MHILRDRAEAEDVCQDVFIRLWKNIGQVESETARPWLLRVTRNACIDRLRKHREYEGLGDEVNDVSASTSDEPQSALIKEQLSHWLKAAIGKLGEPYRSLVHFREFQQDSYEDIGRKLLLTNNQVKVYLHRA